MADVLVACPTAEVKDYALEAYTSAYTAMQEFGTDKLSLFMVDTTPQTYTYMDRLHRMGIHAVHMEPPYYPMVDCLVYTVNKAWELIIEEAWRQEVDYIFSIESDIIVHHEACDIMVYQAEENDASVVAHWYPYAGQPYGVRSLGCTLFDRRLFEPGESLHNPKNPNVYAVGGGGNFEDELYDKPRSLGKRIITLDGFIELTHWQSEEAKTFHGRP